MIFTGGLQYNSLQYGSVQYKFVKSCVNLATIYTSGTLKHYSCGTQGLHEYTQVYLKVTKIVKSVFSTF